MELGRCPNFWKRGEYVVLNIEPPPWIGSVSRSRVLFNRRITVTQREVLIGTTEMSGSVGDPGAVRRNVVYDVDYQR